VACWVRRVASYSSATTAALLRPPTPVVESASGNFPPIAFGKASPMTYTFDGKQYVTVASGQSIIAFGLID